MGHRDFVIEQIGRLTATKNKYTNDPPPYTDVIFQITNYIKNMNKQGFSLTEQRFPGPPEKEQINHPNHYGGKDNPFEAIKVIEAWRLNFHLGNTVKYIVRAGKKSNELQDLKKAQWYLNRKIEQLENQKLDERTNCKIT